jgi:type II secretory pathway predicted ATPase ExeA
LLQIVFAGQEELSTKILRYRELASRMFPIAINAMSSKDLEEMIRFRWMVAGGKAMPFADGEGAYKALYVRSKGLPRDAVKVCDEVLWMLLVDGKKQATAADVDQIANELNLVK